MTGADTKILTDENIVWQQKVSHIAIKIHREYDYWLYMPTAQKPPAGPAQDRQLFFDWSAS